MTRWGGLTPRGVAFVVGGVLLLVVAWTIHAQNLVWPAVGAILLPLLSLVATWSAYPRLRVSREVNPELVPAGAEINVDLTLTNVSVTWGSEVEATDEFPPGFGGAHHFGMGAQNRGQVTRNRAVLSPRRRGRFVLDGLEYRTTDPLGLATRVARVSAPAGVRVTPMMVEVPATSLRASGREGDTPIPQSSVSGPDDAMVREYQPRDDVRRIHWPLTARTGELMVRREEQAWDPSAWILLDSRVWDGTRATRVTFEWQVSLVASWGVRLADEGFELHLVDAAGETFVATGSTPVARSASWLEHLVDVTTTADDSLGGGVQTVTRASTGHVMLAVLGRLDVADARQLVATGTSRNHALVVPPPQERAAEHERAAAILTSHGWVVRTVPVGSRPLDWETA